MYEFKRLVNYFISQVYILSFPREHSMVPAFPKNPNSQRKEHFPQGFTRDIIVANSTIHIQPLLKVAPPKGLICLLNSQLHPHKLDSSAVSQSMQDLFRTSMVDEACIVIHNSPPCKANLHSNTIKRTPPKKSFHSRQRHHFPYLASRERSG